jgi:hypothetical protein
MPSLAAERAKSPNKLDMGHMIEVYKYRNTLQKGKNVKRYTFDAHPILVITQLQLWLELLGCESEMVCFVS